jgi:hypothetical protein
LSTVGTQLSTREQSILQNLLDGSNSLEVTIPDSASNVEIWEMLSVCCRAIGHLTKTSNRIKPMIGRLLLLIQQTPSVFKEQGFKSYNDFLENGVCHRLGLSRAHLFEAMSLSRKWPNLSVERFAKIGSVKMNIVSRFTNETHPSANRILDMAEKMSIEQLRGWAEKSKLIEAGEDSPEVITIASNKTVLGEWKEFSSDPRVHAVCGSAHPGTIFRHMIQEAHSWLNNGGGPILDEDGMPPWEVTQ